MDALIPLLLLILLIAGPTALITALTVKRRTEDLEGRVADLEREREVLTRAREAGAVEAAAPKETPPALPSQSELMRRAKQASAPAPPPAALSAEKAPAPLLPVTKESPARAEKPVERPEKQSPAEDPDPGFDWEKILKAMRLLPPTGEGAEVGLVAWWTTRIGLLLGVIAAVFFGVYVNQNAQPWIKLAELVGTGLGVFLLGRYCERRHTEFGQSLATGGLGLLYVAAYACYGLEAMKVTDSVPLGIAMQVLGVLLVVGWGIWRNLAPAAVLGLAMGYTTCLFSSRWGFDPFPLCGLICLGLGAAALFLWRGWRPVLLTGVIGSFLGVVMLALFRWNPGDDLAFLYPALLLAIFLAALGIRTYRNRAEASWNERMVLLSTVVALGAAALCTARTGTTFETYFLVYTGILALAAVLWGWRFGLRSIPVQALGTKALAYLGMWAIAAFDGPIEQFVLLGEAASVAIANRSLRWRPLDFVTPILWAIALFLFANDWTTWSREQVEPFSTTRLLGCLFALLGTALSAWFAQSLRKAGREEGLEWSPFFAVPFAGVGLASSLGYHGGMEGIQLGSLLAIALIGVAWFLRSKLVGALAGAVVALLGIGLGAMGWLDQSEFGTAPLVTWFFSATCLFAWIQRCLDPESERRVAPVLYGLAAHVGAGALLATDLEGAVWPLLAALGLAYATGGRFARVTGLAEAAWIPLGLGILQAILLHHSETLESPWLGVVFALATWGVAGWMVPEKDAWLGRLVGVFAGFALASFGAGNLWSIVDRPSAALLLLTAAGLLLPFLGSRRWLVAGTGIGVALLLLATALALVGTGDLGVAGLVLSAGWVAFSFLLRENSDSTDLSPDRICPAIGAILGLWLLGGSRHFDHEHATVWWGLLGLAIFLVGLFGRSLPHRAVGLSALAATIGRMFLVDLDDTVGRIIAFAVTAVVLVGIGYLYARFRDRIEL